jgi:hypothetical protein
MLLDSLVGHGDPWSGTGEHYQRVEAWCNTNGQELTQDNALTLKILPWALRTFEWTDEPQHHSEGRFMGLKTPVFIEGDLETNQTLDGGGGTQVWYNPTLLAEAWKRENHGRVDQRTESQTALDQQSAALGGGKSKQKKVSGRNLRFRPLPPEYVPVVVARSLGGS